MQSYKNGHLKNNNLTQILERKPQLHLQGIEKAKLTPSLPIH